MRSAPLWRGLPHEGRRNDRMWNDGNDEMRKRRAQGIEGTEGDHGDRSWELSSISRSRIWEM